MSAPQSETIGLLWLHRCYTAFGIRERDCFWFDEILRRYKNGQSVLRSIQISKIDYKQHLRSIQVDENVINLTDEFPDRFWMIEISCTELFSTNRHKVGEILLHPDIRNDMEALIAFRFPGVFVAKIPDTTLTAFPTHVKTHTDVFCLAPSETT